MYRIRIFMVAFAIIAAVLFTSVFATGAHAATKPSGHAVNHTVNPDVSSVPCWYFHAVEIINNKGESCFENRGVLLVNIYNVTSILDTGNDGYPESFECNHSFLVELTAPGQSWSGYCYDLTAITL